MKLIKMRSFLLNIIFFISFSGLIHAQFWGGSHWGAQVGLSINIGTHIQQVGLKIQGYYTYKFVQVNVGNHIRFNSLNLGDRTNYIANRINTGVVLLAGKHNSSPQFILDGLTHQTRYDYGLAYNFLWYFDNAGTSQQSGGFGLHIKQFSILFENDIFAGSGDDRFRTSDLTFLYHNGRFNLSLNTILWTGQTNGASKRQNNEKLNAKGYFDLSNMPYGKTSHGIISAGIDYQVFYGNVVSASIGIDSERIRNVLQNRLIHDQIFLPKAWRHPNTKYPMLDPDGMPTLELERVAPARLYFQLGLNKTLTY